MSIHISLKAGSKMTRHRNVLKRDERIQKLESEERWNEEKGSVVGLPKVRSIKLAVKGKKKKE